MKMRQTIKMLGILVNILAIGSAQLYSMESSRDYKSSKSETTEITKVCHTQPLTELCVKKIGTFLAAIAASGSSKDVSQIRTQLAKLPEELRWQIDHYYCQNHAFSNKQNFTFPLNMNDIEISSDETFVIGLDKSTPVVRNCTADSREIRHPYTIYL